MNSIPKDPPPQLCSPERGGGGVVDMVTAAAAAVSFVTPFWYKGGGGVSHIINSKFIIVGLHLVGGMWTLIGPGLFIFS